jgi:DNA-binding NarL/FixJ family response regulator
MTRIIIADDQALVRGGLRMILEAEGDLEVVAEVEDGRQAVSMTRELLPDVILMDVRMPVVDGLAATRQIVAEGLPSRVLVLTTFDNDEVVYEALRAGASGFLLKTAPPATLGAAVRTVAGGDALLAPSVTRRLIEDFVGHARAVSRSPALDELTQREREVLEIIGRGLSNREIADRLVVSEATVKTHVNRVFAKLQLRDRTQAVIFAYESGLVRPGQHPSSSDA